MGRVAAGWLGSFSTTRQVSNVKKACLVCIIGGYYVTMPGLSSIMLSLGQRGRRRGPFRPPPTTSMCFVFPSIGEGREDWRKPIFRVTFSCKEGFLLAFFFFRGHFCRYTLFTSGPIVAGAGSAATAAIFMQYAERTCWDIIYNCADAATARTTNFSVSTGVCSLIFVNQKMKILDLNG